MHRTGVGSTPMCYNFANKVTIMEPQVQEPAVEKHPVHQVTPVSKYLAMALFIILPFVGGYVGYQLAPERVIEVEKVIQTPVQEIESNEVVTEPVLPGWNTYTDEFEGYSYQYPPSWINNTEPRGLNTLSYVSDVDPATLKQDREVPINSFSVLSEFADCQSAVMPVTFAGKSATEAPWGPAMVEEIRYICFDDGMAILLTANFDDNQKEFLETMLSTFRFTEKVTGALSEGTYTSPNGFSLSIPEGSEVMEEPARGLYSATTNFTGDFGSMCVSPSYGCGGKGVSAKVDTAILTSQDGIEMNVTILRGDGSNSVAMIVRSLKPLPPGFTDSAQIQVFTTEEKLPVAQSILTSIKFLE